MSIISALSAIWSHRPTPAAISAAEEIFRAAKEFIAVIEAQLPDIEGKEAAIDAVNQAVMQSHVVLAHAAHRDASGASDAAAASAADTAPQATP